MPCADMTSGRQATTMNSDIATPIYAPCALCMSIAADLFNIEFRQCIKREKEFPLGFIIRSQKRHGCQGIVREADKPLESLGERCRRVHDSQMDERGTCRDLNLQQISFGHAIFLCGLRK